MKLSPFENLKRSTREEKNELNESKEKVAKGHVSRVKNKQTNKYLLVARSRYSKNDSQTMLCLRKRSRQNIEKNTFFKYLMSMSLQTLVFRHPRANIHTSDIQCSFDNNCLTRAEKNPIIKLFNKIWKLLLYSCVSLLDVAFLIVYWKSICLNFFSNVVRYSLDAKSKSMFHTHDGGLKFFFSPFFLAVSIEEEKKDHFLVRVPKVLCIATCYDDWQTFYF